MSCHDAFDLFPRQFTFPTHVKCLEQLRDLEVQRLLTLLLMELGNLPLDLLHDGNFTLKELAKGAYCVIARLSIFAST